MIEAESGPTRSTLGESLGLAALGLGLVALGLGAAWLIRGGAGTRSRPTSASLAILQPSSVSPSQRGPLLYQVHCVRCHGVDGHGDGPDSANLRPSPRDFAASDWKFGPTPEAIRRVILQGIPGSSMYALGTSLTSRELDALVEHVRTLGPKSPGTASILEAGLETPTTARQAPGFDAEDRQGQTRSLRFDRGRLTLLAFWGTGCAPCQEELPELEKLASDLNQQGLDVIPVCVDEPERGRVDRILRGKFDRFPSYLSVDGMARIRFDLQALPQSFLIDRKGRILAIARGRIHWNGEPARRLIAEALAASR